MPTTSPFNHISINVPDNVLQQAIKNAGQTTGILLLSDLPSAPLSTMASLVDNIASRPDIQDKVNDAYRATGAEKLVWKDSFANGRGGPKVDQKRVLDLAPHRLTAIQERAPEVASQLGDNLYKSLDFFQNLEKEIVPRLLRLLGGAAGVEVLKREGEGKEEWGSAYRMVDYYARGGEWVGEEEEGVPPRCGEHRDYGTMTLIFQDETGGLEVFVEGEEGEEGEWVPVPGGETVLLFGWCTKVRSNDRMNAALHRVVNPKGRERGQEEVKEEKEEEVPRRMAAILFIAPLPEARVVPVVEKGEGGERYEGLEKAGDLKGIMARKWEMREGTIEKRKVLKELDEQKLFKTQDDIVRHVFGRS